MKSCRAADSGKLRGGSDLSSFKVLHQLVGFRCEESDMVDHAGIVPGPRSSGCRDSRARVRHAGLRHMHLILAVDASQ